MYEIRPISEVAGLAQREQALMQMSGNEGAAPQQQPVEIDWERLGVSKQADGLTHIGDQPYEVRMIPEHNPSQQPAANEPEPISDLAKAEYQRIIARDRIINGRLENEDEGLLNGLIAEAITRGPEQRISIGKQGSFSRFVGKLIRKSK